MKSYKRKEYTLFLILLYTALTFCDPCINQTLNAIPYPTDCQAFILCWLSRAYLQTCPNDLYFDIKTNNCQPLVATTCCNMTLPLLIIPIPIYQGSTGPTNKTKIWPFTYTSAKQKNSTIPSSSLSSYLSPKTTFITSSNHHEATTSIISTWNESTDLNQSSKFTLSVTEQTEREISTRFKSANNEVDVTESTISIDSGRTNVYRTSSISSTTEFQNENFNSSSIVLTDISEAITPIVSTLWTDSSGSSSSGFTLNTEQQAEIETTTQPINSTYIRESTQFEESKKTESYTNAQQSPTIVSFTEPSNNNPSSTSIISTNTPQTTIPIIFTLWKEMTDSTESLSSDLKLNVTEWIKLSTIPLEKANTYTYTTKDFRSSQPNAYTTDSYTNNRSTISTNRIIETTTPTISTQWTDLIYTNQRSSKIESTLSETTSIYNFVTEVTEEYNQTASSTASTLDLSSNKYSTTLHIATTAPDTTTSTLSTELTNTSQNSLSSEVTFAITERTKEDSMVSLETSSTDSNVITKSVDSSETNFYLTTLIESSTEYNNDTHLKMPSTTNFPTLATFDSTLNPLRIDDSITTDTADMTISSKTFPTITPESLGTELLTINSSFFLTKYSTTELDVSSTTSEYSTNTNLNTSVSRFPEYTQNAETMVMPTSSSDFTDNNEYITQENLSTRLLLDQSYSTPEVSTINSLTSSTMLSTDTNSIITTDTLPRKYEIFTESSTLLPLASSTTNIVSPKNLYFPKISSTTERGEPFTEMQYSKDEISIKSSHYFTEVTTPERVSITTAEYEPTVTSSRFETTNINLISPIMTSLSNVSTTDALQTEPQIFTGSTLSPIFSSTTNNLILSSTTEDEGLSIIPQFTENISPDFKTTKENEFSSLEAFSKTELFTNTGISQSSLLPFISTTNAPKSETTSILTSSSETLTKKITETTKYMTMESETTLVPFLTTVQSSSPRTFTTESIWDPVTFTLPLSPLNFNTTAEYTTNTAVTTDSTILSSELNVTNNPHITSTLSTFPPKFTKTTKYVIESPSTTFESLPISTETKDGTAMRMDSSILTTEPIIYTENSLQTNSETQKIQSTTPEEIKSTLLLTTLLTYKPVTASTDKTTGKSVITQTVRTLPPLPYSPPPCAFTTTTQKSTSSEKPLITIPPIVTSTYITPETHEPFSKPVCGFRDKFVFPDESDCNHYYECLYGGIRKVICRYGYEFNPYALKCMPHLEANCQRRKSFKNVMELLYYITKLNLGSRDLTKYQENHQDNQESDEESETK